MIEAVIFDLDGVIVSTDEYHYQAWKKLSVQEGIFFDRETNERLRGVSRMESLEIILEKADKEYSDSQKQEMASRKNTIYRELLKNVDETDILPGVNDFLLSLKNKNIRIAIGSSSKNAPFILEQIGMGQTFEAIADGNQIQNSKPDPEVFLLAAQKLNISANRCLVVEDAEAGVSAAINGGMKVLAVGAAHSDNRADYQAKDLSQISVEEVLN